MDRDTIRRMDPELYQEKLEKAVMDDVSCILNINKGHSSVLHAGQSIDDMAMRVVKEGKQAVSSFYNAESLIGNLQLNKIAARWPAKAVAQFFYFF